MIGKVCRRGTDVRRLLGYLFLEGQAGERGLASDHSDARLVAGYEDLGPLQPSRGSDGRFDVRSLAALLNAPVLAGGVGADAKPVYHLAISAAKADRLLSDSEWADIAAEYAHRIGLAPRGDDAAVRWVAVRHLLTTCTWSRRCCGRTVGGCSRARTTSAREKPAVRSRRGTG